MKPRYTDAFWGEHPFDGDMILIKNKNKNKNNLARQMQLVLNRQERRSPRYSRIADLVARRDCGASAMPGGRLGGSNRGTRRHVSVAGLMQQTSVHAVS